MFSTNLIRQSIKSSKIVTKRTFSGGHESFEEAKLEVAKWTKLTIGNDRNKYFVENYLFEPIYLVTM